MTDTVRVPREPTPEMVRAGCAVTCVECFADCKSSDAAAIYRAMLAASPQGEGDWTTHDGGPNPVPGKMVDVRFRDGEILREQTAEDDCWSHIWGSADIIAYRVTEGVKP